jgi:hypothetical protein
VTVHVLSIGRLADRLDQVLTPDRDGSESGEWRTEMSWI